MRPSTPAKGRIAAAILLSLLLAAGPTRSAGKRDVEVAVRALEFLAQPIRDDVVMGIVHAPGTPGTRDAAENLARELSGGVRTANIRLTARPIALDELSGTDAVISGVDVLFLPEGLEGQYDRIFADALRLKIPTVSADPLCVTRDRCLMAVRTVPRVEITVSRAVAARYGVEFQSPFRLMVTIR